MDDVVATSGAIYLIDSFKEDDGTTAVWTCRFNNTSTTADVPVKVTMTCLNPAQ